MDTIPVGQAVLQKVVVKLGGANVASDQLEIPVRLLQHYLHGRVPVPNDLLLRAVDIVLEDSPGSLKGSQSAHG